MKFLIIYILLLFPLLGKSQQLLNKSESEIRETISNDFFEGKRYTEKGEAYLSYKYPKPLAGMHAAKFYLNDNDICYAILQNYIDINYLEIFVNSFKSNKNLIRVPNEFGWINNKENYDIAIQSDNKVFTVMYRSRK